MNPLRSIIVCLGLSAVGFTACRENAAPKPMTIDQTKDLILKTELDAIEYPTESLETRAARIRQLVAPYGLTVLISDSVKGTREVDWIRMPKPTMAMLFKFTCGNRQINWRLVPGGVEFFWDNDYRGHTEGDIVSGDEGIDPFASPSEPKEEVIDDPDDPFKPMKKANRVPGSDQPRVPHHPAYVSVQGGSYQTRAFGP